MLLLSLGLSNIGLFIYITNIDLAKSNRFLIGLSIE